MADEPSAKTTELFGWCQGLTCCEASFPASPARRLTGLLVLSSPIYLSHGATERRALHTLQFTVNQSSDTHAEDESHDNEAVLFGMKQGVRLFLNLDANNNDLEGALFASLSEGEFDKMSASAKTSQRIWVRLVTPDCGYLTPYPLKDGHAALVGSALNLNFAPDFAPDNEWTSSRQSSDLREALRDTHFGKGQVDYFIKELCVAAASTAGPVLTGRARIKKLEAIRELVEIIRPAFIERTPYDTSGYSSLWDLTPPKFEAAIADRDEPTQKVQKAKYDKLWQHYQVLSVVKLGEKNAGALKDGLQPYADVLEEVSAKLLSIKGVSSPYLEWALLDALLYAECIAFAQMTVSGKMLLGMPLQSELEGVSAKKSFFQALKSGAGSLVVEVLTIAVVFFVSDVLTGQNAQTAWLMTAVVMAGRWVSQAVASTAKAPASAVAELLNKMASAHELLKTPAFNAPALRDALYRVADHGAVFSPWVFNILDARIRREGAGGG